MDGFELSATYNWASYYGNLRNLSAASATLLLVARGSHILLVGAMFDRVQTSWTADRTLVFLMTI